MILSSSDLLRPVAIWVPWLIVGLVNPFAEEWYWRGLLLDAAKVWSSWLVIPLVSVLFSLNHLLGIGVTSLGGVPWHEPQADARLISGAPPIASGVVDR
ncbi:MAG: CPBP family intramembrane metalloprotease [Chloroflexi bacterium]|nr:CPBP family intramembrane metalloprotease [Chloroflexota bacterium]